MLDKNCLHILEVKIMLSTFPVKDIYTCSLSVFKQCIFLDVGETVL